MASSHPDATPGSLSAPGRVLLAAGVFLALHLVLAVWRPWSFWGVDFLAYWAKPFWVVFLVLAAATLFPGRLPLRGWFPDRLFERPASAVHWLTWLFVLAATGALLLAARSAIHLLGDGYLFIGELDIGHWDEVRRTDRAPLTYWLIGGLHALGGSLWSGGETTYRIYSMVSGLLYVPVAVFTATVVGRTLVERRLLAGLLLTGGLMQVFFGYVENYAIHLPLALLYLALGLLSLRGRVGAWAPGLVLGVLVPLHFVYLFLVPAHLALLIMVWRSRPDQRATVSTLTGLFLPPALAVLLFAVIGFDVVAYLASGPQSHLLPVLGEPGFRQHYRMFSGAHFLDLLNVILLSAPAVLLALAAAGWRGARNRDGLFLGAAACGTLAFTFLANPEIGAFRDWDILSIPGLSLALLAGLVLIRGIPGERLGGAGAVLLGALALHTALWVGTNAVESTATHRFADSLERCSLSGHARSYGWESLGSFYRSLGDTPRAEAAFAKAVKAAPGNPRHWIDQAVLHRDAGRLDEALQCLDEALRLAPDRADTHHRRGAVLNDAGRHQEAAAAFERAIALQPNYAEAYLGLGNAYTAAKNYPQAAAAFRNAIQHRPDYAEAYANLAWTFYAGGRFDDALRSADEALRLDPGYANAMYTAGAANLGLKRPDQARAWFEKFLATDPGNPLAPTVRKLLQGASGGR